MKKTTQSKSPLILSFPSTMTAPDVVAACKRKGVTVSANYVYHVRAASKKKRAPKPTSKNTYVVPKSVTPTLTAKGRAKVTATRGGTRNEDPDGSLADARRDFADTLVRDAEALEIRASKMRSVAATIRSF